ncbi:unnamed protein product, partial [Prorocentrum cordatum]
AGCAEQDEAPLVECKAVLEPRVRGAITPEAPPSLASAKAGGAGAGSAGIITGIGKEQIEELVGAVLPFLGGQGGAQGIGKEPIEESSATLAEIRARFYAIGVRARMAKNAQYQLPPPPLPSLHQQTRLAREKQVALKERVPAKAMPPSRLSEQQVARRAGTSAQKGPSAEQIRLHRRLDGISKRQEEIAQALGVGADGGFASTLECLSVALDKQEVSTDDEAGPPAVLAAAKAVRNHVKRMRKKERKEMVLQRDLYRPGWHHEKEAEPEAPDSEAQRLGLLWVQEQLKRRLRDYLVG